MVQPRQSSHFEFYQEGSGSIVVPFRNSSIYTEDRLGLKVRNFFSIFTTNIWQFFPFIFIMGFKMLLEEHNIIIFLNIGYGCGEQNRYA